MELRRPLAPAIRLTLGPCPFCGDSPRELAEVRRFEGMHCRTLHQVICRCGAAGPERSSPGAAGQAWDAPFRTGQAAGRQPAPALAVPATR